MLSVFTHTDITCPQLTALQCSKSGLAPLYCCKACRAYATPWLGPNCTHGDLSPQCNAINSTSQCQLVAEYCCQTCCSILGAPEGYSCIPTTTSTTTTTTTATTTTTTSLSTSTVETMTTAATTTTTTASLTTAYTSVTHITERYQRGLFKLTISVSKPSITNHSCTAGHVNQSSEMYQQL